MKSVIIIMGVATVMAVVYGLDLKHLQQFNKDLTECNKEIGGALSENVVDKIRCALLKDGKLIDANGGIVKEEMLKSFEDGISDTNKLEQAKKHFNKCYEEAQSEGNVKERTTKIITCNLPLLDFLDKVN